MLTLRSHVVHLSFTTDSPRNAATVARALRRSLVMASSPLTCAASAALGARALFLQVAEKRSGPAPRGANSRHPLSPRVRASCANSWHPRAPRVRTRGANSRHPLSSRVRASRQLLSIRCRRATSRLAPTGATRRFPPINTRFWPHNQPLLQDRLRPVLSGA